MLTSSSQKNYVESIEKIDQIKKELQSISTSLDSLHKKSKQLTPFSLRRQKLKSPYNKCKCLINYKKSQLNIQQDEECHIEDNSQKIKWKIVKANGQSGFVPSVCFILPPVDEDSVDLVDQLKLRFNNLIKQANSCQLQFKKDRLFSLMNTIKFCELDEYESRKNSKNKEQDDLNLLLTRIKSDIDELIKESASSSISSSYFSSDMKILIESYEKCCKILNELNEKSIIKDECEKLEKQIKSDTECLELKLKYLNESLAQLESMDKFGKANKVEFIEKVIQQYQVS